MNKDFPDAKLASVNGKTIVDQISKNETDVSIKIISNSHLVSRQFGRYVPGSIRETTKGYEKNIASD